MNELAFYHCDINVYIKTCTHYSRPMELQIWMDHLLEIYLLCFILNLYIPHILYRVHSACSASCSWREKIMFVWGFTTANEFRPVFIQWISISQISLTNHQSGILAVNKNIAVWMSYFLHLHYKCISSKIIQGYSGTNLPKRITFWLIVHSKRRQYVIIYWCK